MRCSSCGQETGGGVGFCEGSDGSPYGLTSRRLVVLARKSAFERGVNR